MALMSSGHCLTKAECHTYASVNYPISGSDNGLLPDQRQAMPITLISANIMLTGPLGTKIQWHFIQNITISIEENVFENVVCKMSAN